MLLYFLSDASLSSTIKPQVFESADQRQHLAQPNTYWNTQSGL